MRSTQCASCTLPPPKREKGTLRQKAQIIYVDQARKIVARNGRLKLGEKRKKEIMAKVDIFSKF